MKILILKRKFNFSKFYYLINYFYVIIYMINLDEYKVIKELGRGLVGTTYLVKDSKGAKYALKIENILKKDVPKSLSSAYWRELDFIEFMGKKYPDHILHLKENYIIDNCDHEQSWEGFPFEMSDLPKGMQTYYKKLFASSYCAIKVYSLIDMDMSKYIKRRDFDTKVFYDLLIQLIYIVNLLDKHGYMHGDLHTNNIGLVKTNKKYINILGKRIPTHGYHIQLIDYGSILHRKYTMTKGQKKIYNETTDLHSILLTLLFEIYYMKIIKKFKNVNFYKDAKIDKEDKIILEKYVSEKGNNSRLLDFLYKIIFVDKYLKEVSGEKYKFQDNNLIKPIPDNVLQYYIHNILSPLKVLKYMLQNRT